MRCPYCNSEIASGAFCTKCGNRLPQPPQPPVQPVRGYEHEAQHTGVNKGLLAAVICLMVVLVIVVVLIAVKLTAPKNYNAPVDNSSQVQQVSPEEAVQATAEPTPEPITYPVFTDIFVSSTRGTDTSSRGEVVDYNKRYLMDGILTNCWTPDRHYDSAPWFELRADSPQRVTGIRFTDGYFKSQETYNRNRRISKVEIIYAGGSIIYDCPYHVFGEMQDVTLPEPVDTDYIRVNILSTIYGDWLDTCVSEVEVY